MLIWIITCGAVLFMVLLGSAGYVALFVRDAARRADAYKVLKLLTGILAGTGGAGGFVSVLLKLHDSSVL